MWLAQQLTQPTAACRTMTSLQVRSESASSTVVLARVLALAVVRFKSYTAHSSLPFKKFLSVAGS